MSTSTGEEGFCIYCGHAMDGHTKANHSKCKRCKKRVLVCQATVHDSVAGWRICHVPCRCGEKHFPSTAKAARHLEPTEFASSHPDYQSPEEAGDPEASYEQTTTFPDSSAIAMPEAESSRSTAHQQTAHSSHRRTYSAESVDELQWNSARLAEETVVAGMASLVIDDATAEADIVKVKARYTKEGKVQFTTVSGQTIRTLGDYWIATDDGYEFKYEGIVYFAKEIKRAKK
ncbi:uncharacterized protein F5Z01DRAFT_640709 [Emericellopsis atlantica]|uniref:Uncharacterized protein n=1 Tax=Emericellopsis atlantica TaxID=2614577 RepID=A0A9P8CJZ4_9HYPO|nr:uncharacterized protein F5Z01DRAFT_640709 [Emericellopsis atlantica]KAG9249989.1 hypothetical protein F5Z01DRAFT_640709 [Emericellopsis atlantica]